MASRSPTKKWPSVTYQVNHNTTTPPEVGSTLAPRLQVHPRALSSIRVVGYPTTQKMDSVVRHHEVNAVGYRHPKQGTGCEWGLRRSQGTIRGLVKDQKIRHRSRCWLMGSLGCLSLCKMNFLKKKTFKKIADGERLTPLGVRSP